MSDEEKTLQEYLAYERAEIMAKNTLPQPGQ